MALIGGRMAEGFTEEYPHQQTGDQQEQQVEGLTGTEFSTDADDVGLLADRLSTFSIRKQTSYR